MLELNQSDFKHFVDKMPSKSVIADYISLDNCVKDGENLDENEERKVTDRPKKLFDKSKGISFESRIFYCIEKTTLDYIVENDNDKTSLNFQQVLS